MRVGFRCSKNNRVRKRKGIFSDSDLKMRMELTCEGIPVHADIETASKLIIIASMYIHTIHTGTGIQIKSYVMPLVWNHNKLWGHHHFT